MFDDRRHNLPEPYRVVFGMDGWRVREETTGAWIAVRQRHADAVRLASELNSEVTRRRV